MAAFGGVCFLDFFIRVPEVPVLIPQNANFGRFGGIRNGTSGTRIKKVQTPNVAILRPYETLGQVSEIRNYFFGYFIIFHVFPM